MHDIWRQEKSRPIRRNKDCILVNSSCSPSDISSSGDFLRRFKLDSEQTESCFCSSHGSSTPCASFFFRLYYTLMAQYATTIDEPISDSNLWPTMHCDLPCLECPFLSFLVPLPSFDVFPCDVPLVLLKVQIEERISKQLDPQLGVAASLRPACNNGSFAIRPKPSKPI